MRKILEEEPFYADREISLCEGSKNLQVGSWLPPAASTCQRASPSGLLVRARRFASRTPKAKTMKKRITKYQCRRTVRITQAEDEMLQRQAAIARISVAEYMRRKFFGGRPIIARTDDLAIRELRRLGGLLKHNFILTSENNQKGTWHEMNKTLRKIQEAIDYLGRENDPQEV